MSEFSSVAPDFSGQLLIKVAYHDDIRRLAIHNEVRQARQPTHSTFPVSLSPLALKSVPNIRFFLF